MASAATRAKEAWQPRGGYVDPRSMKAVRFEGARPLFPAASENVHPSVVETAVRRLLALIAGDTVEGAFSECVVSALVVGQRDDALRLRADIRGLDDASVASACRLSAYEAALEAGIALHAEDVTRMRPNAATLANVRTMVESASGFLKGRRLVARALGRQDLGLRARRGGHALSRHLPALGPALPLRPAFPADIGTGRREPEAPCGVRGRRGGHPACRHARDRKEGRRRRGRRVPAPAGFRTCKKAPLTRGLFACADRGHSPQSSFSKSAVHLSWTPSLFRVWSWLFVASSTASQYHFSLSWLSGHCTRPAIRSDSSSGSL